MSIKFRAGRKVLIVKATPQTPAFQMILKYLSKLIMVCFQWVYLILWILIFIVEDVKVTSSGRFLSFLKLAWRKAIEKKERNL